MVLAIYGLQVNELKNKKHFTFLTVIFFIIIAINFFCIFFYCEEKSISILIFSQFTFILLFCVSYYIIKKALSDFFKNILMRMDQMINQEIIDTHEIIDDTYISQIYHRLYHLYDILLAQQHSIASEKSKLQSFISDISHQVKTPITTLKLLQSALEHPNLSNEEFHKYLNTQGKQIEKMDFLIHSLFKLSYLENEIISLHSEITSVTSTILSSLEGILISAARKNIEVSYDNSKDYELLHDTKWTCEALFNILENAIKYTPPSGLLNITVSTR